ncbi:MAG: S8 family serine peptidase [Candidatus Cloacimonadia bacterium]
MKFKVFMVLLIAIMSTVSLLANDLVKSSQQLQEAIDSINSVEEKLPIFIVMKEQLDTQVLYNSVKDMDRVSRREFSMKELKTFSQASQKDLTTILDKLAKEKKVDEVRHFWVRNIVGLKATKEVIEFLETRAEISSIEYDPLTKALFGEWNPVDVDRDDVSRVERDIPYNLTKMNVPEVWNLGFKGDGVVVAVLDTGVDYNHKDLLNRMWVSPDYPNFGYNFVGNNNDPMDDNGHGTHCAGTVAGDGTSGTQTGIAPLSKIMALKVLSRQGDGSQTGVWSAMEFACENGADLLSMSLGWEYSSHPTKVTWRGILENMLNMGIIASIAGGNEGALQNYGKNKIPNNIRTPGDCPPAWLHPDQEEESGGISSVITVGATDKSDDVALFSSKGPVTWTDVPEYNDYPYQPGRGLTKPDIVAPGVDVVSLRVQSIDGYTVMSGTSMAAPSVSGVIALMLSKDPSLMPEEICQILQENSVRLFSKKNNQAGAGRADALATIEAVDPNRPPNQPREFYPVNHQVKVSVNPLLKWYNGGGAQKYYVHLGTDNPPTNVFQGVIATDTFYKVEIELERDTRYFWRVDAENNFGSVEGVVWNFTTELPISEGFENGDFSKYNWEIATNGGENSRWHITDQDVYTGKYAARSGKSGNNTTTVLSVSLEVLEDGEISFFRKVSSEYYDYLRFYIDTDLIEEWSGEVEWDKFEYPVTAGSRTFKWSYVKDSMGAEGADAAWIDEITFPPHPTPMTIYAPESFICEADLEYINLSWELQENDNVDPSQFKHLGYNVYLQYNNYPYYKINDQYINSPNFKEKFTKEGEFTYYVTASYDQMGKIVESAPSEERSITIHPAVSNPVFTPPAGEYNKVVNIQITSDEKTTIFYTIDTTEPSIESLQYTKPLVGNEPFVLKAKAYKEGYLASGTTIGGYNIYVSAEDEANLLPDITSLRVYPNPVDLTKGVSRSGAGLTIEYNISTDSELNDITVYNIKGQLIERFTPINTVRGVNSFVWNMNNVSNKEIGSGVYFVRLQTDSESVIKRVMVIK